MGNVRGKGWRRGEGEDRGRKSVSAEKEEKLGRTGQMEWRRGAKGEKKSGTERGRETSSGIAGSREGTIYREGWFEKERKGREGRERYTRPGCSVAFEGKGNGGIYGRHDGVERQGTRGRTGDEGWGGGPGPGATGTGKGKP